MTVCEGNGGAFDLTSSDDEAEEQETGSSEMIEYVSPAQLDEQLVTLSLLPDSRWKNLLHLDVIKVGTWRTPENWGCDRQHTASRLKAVP